MSEISTMLEHFVSKCASDENLRNKAMGILTNTDRSEWGTQFSALAEEAGVPMNAEEAMKLVEDPEVLGALGLGSLSSLLGGGSENAEGASTEGAEGGLGDILSMAENILGKK